MKSDSLRTKPASLLPRLIATLLGASAFFGALTATRADDAGGKVHALFDLNFSDKYLTPRGMIVQDHGLTTQVLLLGLIDVYDGGTSQGINNITVVAGFWNDYATSPIPEHLAAHSRGTDWIEIDPILGVSVSFAKSFKLDVTYTEFAMQILDIGTSQHLETKLSYDDSGALGAWALHPYVSYWKELTGKATAAANFHVPSSYYFEAGIAPGFSAGGVKFDVPIRALLPSTEFYGETFAPKSTVALYEAGVKASGGAAFMPKGYGHWSWHLGVRYVKFEDKNLQQLATAGGFGQPTKDTAQIYAGLTSFF